MSKKYYSTKIVGVGGDVPKFLNVVKMLVMFDDSMVLPELREFSVLHSGNKLEGDIKPGDILNVAGTEFEIIKVGEDVHSNIRTLGHIIIKFDGGMGELLAGSIHVEDKTIPKIQVGDEISISEASAALLKGKKFAITGAENDLNKKVAQVLRDSGAEIVGEDAADAVVNVK
jgi:PTS system glucitol/sorbitol-specific IIA component